MGRRFEPRLALALLRVIVTVIAIWLILRHVDLGSLVDLLKRAEPERLFWAGVVLVVQFAVVTLRWQLTIELLGHVRVPVAGLAVSLGRSMLLSQPLPSTIGGDVVRTLFVSRTLGFALAARSVISDRILALVVLMALVLLSLPSVAFLPGAGGLVTALALLCIGGLAAFGVALRNTAWLRSLPWLGASSAIVGADLRRIVTAGRQGFLLLLLGTLIHSLGVLLIYELAKALGSVISLLDCLLVVPATLLISAIPLSLGGWGVREGALAAGFALVGAESAAGVATSVLFGLTGPLIGLVADLAGHLIGKREAPKNAG